MKNTLYFLRSKLPGAILNTQVANSFVAVLFFYLVPFFGITPKTNLFIYLIISFGLVLVWRLVLFPKIFFNKRKYSAMLIGAGGRIKRVEKRSQ